MKRKFKFKIKIEDAWIYLDSYFGILEYSRNPQDFETLSQYIGIKDEFGNDIYEGDIIIDNNNKNSKTFLHLIEFSTEDNDFSSFYSGFKVSEYRHLDISWNDTYKIWEGVDINILKDYNVKITKESIPYNCIPCIECQIIGNIYDNPELLELLRNKKERML